MEHPGYDSKEDLVTYWRSYDKVPVSLIDEVIEREFEFIAKTEHAREFHVTLRHPPIPHPCGCHECNESPWLEENGKDCPYGTHR